MSNATIDRGREAARPGQVRAAARTSANASSRRSTTTTLQCRRRVAFYTWVAIIPALIASLASVMWSASGGMDGLIKGINIAYDEPPRSLPKRRELATGGRPQPTGRRGAVKADELGPQRAGKRCDMELWIWIVIVIAVIAVIIVIVAWLLLRPSRRLKKQFGSEYDRVLRRTGDKKAARAELEQRLDRHDGYRLRGLGPGERAHYVERWRRLQRHFAKQPATGLLEADDLITRLLDDVGYPTGSFEQQAADLSASHAEVVDDYREARAVVRDTRAGSAGTEEIRQALLRYRGVFERVADVSVARANDENGEAVS